MLKFVLLAFFVESLVEYILSNGLNIGKYKKFAALAAGVGVAFVFNVDLFSEVFGFEAAIPYAGRVLTGLVLGRGSNYLNDLHDRFFPDTAGHMRHCC